MLSHCLWLKYCCRCLIWITNGQNVHFLQKYLNFERWSKYFCGWETWKIDTLVQRFYGCFALQVFEPVTWLKTINTLQIIMLGVNYHYSIYRWQAGTGPALHVHRDMHNTWRQRQREISGRGFITTHCRQYKPKWAVLQRCAVPLISDVQFYIPLFNQVSGEKRQITTNIIIKHIEHHTRTQPAEYSKYSMCANTVTTYYLSDAHAVPPNSEAT